MLLTPSWAFSFWHVSANKFHFRLRRAHYLKFKCEEKWTKLHTKRGAQTSRSRSIHDMSWEGSMTWRGLRKRTERVRESKIAESRSCDMLTEIMKKEKIVSNRKIECRRAWNEHKSQRHRKYSGLTNTTMSDFSVFRQSSEHAFQGNLVEFCRGEKFKGWWTSRVSGTDEMWVSVKLTGTSACNENNLPGLIGKLVKRPPTQKSLRFVFGQLELYEYLRGAFNTFTSDRIFSFFSLAFRISVSVGRCSITMR